MSAIFKKMSGKNTLVFLTFVVIAALFWVLLSFNKELTRDITVNVIIKKPAHVTMIHDVPTKITVTVKQRGLSYFKSLFKPTSTVELNFDKYNNEKNNTLEIAPNQLLGEIRKALGSDVTIIKVMPESFTLKYTTLPGKKVPVNWGDNIKNILPDKQYVINTNQIKTNPDSVIIYALDQATLFSVNEVDIETVEVANLKSTLTKEVRLMGINNVKIVPDKVKLTIPVEPLIKKKYNATISVRNKPEGINVLVFPPSVDCTFLVPQSHFRDKVSLTVVVDYNDINLQKNKVNIKRGEVSENYHNVSMALDSVNYIIERY